METIKTYLKNLFTSYWEYLLVQRACKYNLFDYISRGINTYEDLLSRLKFDKTIFRIFLDALIDRGYLQLYDDKYVLTDKSKLLTDDNSESLKNACLLWAEDHLVAWQNLDYTLKTGLSAFEYIYGKNFFDFIAQDAKKSLNYHRAIAEYARDDYRMIPEIHDFSNHKKIVDVGGGIGTLAMYIKEKYSNIEFSVFDRYEVIEMADESLKSKINFIAGDFFQSIPKADGIILSKVLHDWDDVDALKILQNCYKSLEKEGVLYIIEIDAKKVSVPLLSLNMAIICKSYERSLSNYIDLIQKASFKFVEAKQINDLYTLIISKK